jgi:hypothetical protein
VRYGIVIRSIITTCGTCDVDGHNDEGLGTDLQGIAHADFLLFTREGSGGAVLSLCPSTSQVPQVVMMDLMTMP